MKNHIPLARALKTSAASAAILIALSLAACGGGGGGQAIIGDVHSGL